MSALPRILLPTGVWHAHTLATPLARVLATGESALDAQLPGGGWPLGSLTEILQPQAFHGEWRLLLSALARCGTDAVVLVEPPWTPNACALAACGLRAQRLLWVRARQEAQRLWATEQALRCAGVDAVLAWLPQARSEPLRRLHLAAAEFGKLLFVMRASHTQAESSPAVLRLLLEPQAHSLQVHVLKRRGPVLAQAIALTACTGALACLLAAANHT